MSKGRILIVEDELIVAKDLQKTLMGLGYEVVGRAGTGAEAQEKAAELKPDLVLMDIVLKGGKKGIEAAGEMQETLKVPVVFLTAYGDRETLERVKAVNPFGYILKPYEERELHTAIEVALVRHRLETDLFASEEHFRTLAEMAPAGIYLTSPGGDCQYVNPAWCDMGGIPAEKALGRGWVTAIHPEDRKSLAISWKKTIKEQGIWDREYRLLRPDGRETWVHGRASGIQDDHGNLLGYAGINMDITKRVNLEKALRESEQLYRSLVENSLNAIFLRNESRFLFVNDQFCRLTGYTRKELDTLDPLDIIAPEFRDSVRETGRRRLAGAPTPAEYETHVLRKDGTVRDVVVRAGLVQYLGAPAIQGNFFDITERKKAESALRDSERRLRRIYEDSPLGYQSLDEEGRFLDVNPVWLNLLGYDREEVVGKWFGDFLAPGYVEHFLKNFPCFKSLGAIQGVEFEMVRKDGSFIAFSFDGKIARDEKGRFLQTHCILQDVNERHRLEKQLRQAQKMESIGTLAGGIAHDFNNILGAIMGYTEVALMDARAGDPIRESLEQVRKATFRARDLIKQILAFSRQGEQEMKEIQLGLIVKEALKLLRATIPATIEIRQYLREKDTWIMGDPIQIHQVLMNLCTNALQAMEGRKGLLIVTLEKIELDAEAVTRYPQMAPGPQIRLSISDNGWGIDPGIIDRIFDPFFTTKGLGQGTGMGLAVVHGIVKSHSGLITVYSEKGEGTTFHIYFPSIRQEGSGVEASKAEVVLGGREEVLFVDDEEFLISVGREMLTRLGYRVTSLASAPEALELFRAQPDRFDLVITDQTMPQMTGLELARELLALRPDLPIVLCTGFSEGLTAERAKNIGIRDFIMKPIVLGDLSRTIRKVFDNTDAG